MSGGDLGGARILVSGASAGIGAAVAREALARGAHVAGIGRRADCLAAVEGLVAAPADVRDPESVRGAVDRVVGELGGLDGLVNAAGVNRPGLIADTTPEDWRAILETNVIGLLTVTQAAMPALRAGRGATLVNISSNAGHQVISPQNGVYAASKAAVRSVSDALRLELAGAVRVVEIAPGYVRDTEIHRDYADPAHRAEADARQQELGIELEHFASLLVDVLAQPADVEIRSMLVAKTGYRAKPYGS